jgi:hypothetical protein
MDGMRAVRIASAVSTLLLMPLRITPSPLAASTWLLMSALLFVILLTLHLVRFWQSQSRTTGRLIARLFARCMATAGPVALMSLAFAAPFFTRHHGLVLCESAVFMLVGIACVIPMIFDCWKLAISGGEVRR